MKTIAKRIDVAVLAIVAVALFALAGAGSPWMSDADLKTTFSGRNLAGVYPNGSKFAESYAPDGRLKYADETNKHTGHWSIQAGTFCTIYDGSQTGGCFYVARHSSNCFEFFFVTRTEDEARAQRHGKPSWTARAWHADRASTCDEKPAV